MVTPPAKRQRTENGGNDTLPGIAPLLYGLTGNTALQGHVLPSLHAALPGYLSDNRHHDAGLGFAAPTQYDPGMAPVQPHAAISMYSPAPGVPSSTSQPPTNLKTLHRAIRSLTEQERQDLLYEAAVRHQDIRQFVCSRYEELTRTQQGKVIDFSSHTRGDWSRLQVDLPDHMRDDPAHDPVNAVNDSFSAIASQVHPESSMGTKRNALEALADIVLDIWQSTDNEADYMRDRLSDNENFAINLMRCLEAMTAEELAKLRANDEDVVEKFDELVDLLGGEDGLPELQPAIELLRGDGGDGDEDGSDNTSEDYEKEEEGEVVADDDDGGEDEE